MVLKRLKKDVIMIKKAKKRLNVEIVREISNVEVISHKVVMDNHKGKLHWHDKYEFCQVLSNNLLIVLEGREIRANAGDIVAIDEKSLHQFILDSGGTVVRICQFPLRLLFNFKVKVNSLKSHITAEEIRQIDGLEKRINTLFEMMETSEAVYTSSDPFLQAIVSSVYFLLEKYFSETNTVFADEHDRQEFYKVTSYINDNFKNDVTVDSIAKSLYMSRTKITNVFKKCLGRNINDYITELRVKNANDILANGGSVTIAALESGFHSIRTFHNAYRRVMKMTPSEFINKRKNYF